MRPAPLILMLLAALAGCSPYPEVIAAERTSTAPAAAPPLRPLDELLAQAGTATVTPEITASVTGRAAALRARASSTR